jgi:hypothetical protein
MKNSYTKIIILLSITASAAYCMENPLQNRRNIFISEIENNTGKHLKFTHNNRVIDTSDFPLKLNFSNDAEPTADIRISDINDPGYIPNISFVIKNNKIHAKIWSRIIHPRNNQPYTTPRDEIEVNTPEPTEELYFSIILGKPHLLNSKIKVDRIKKQKLP